MSELSEAINEMRNMRESYDQIGAAAEAYNTGKTELAANITAKGVPASASETLPELAGKVNAIAQESYTIDGGEMYAKQLFGSLETPNYWNLYEVLENLLSDGRLVNYGGILLAEYYKGYDSLALSGAGAGGAYVVSDKDSQGNFIMYTNDTTHTWATDFDGKGNRWVAYCFADEGHDFQITDTNTSPRSIFIGRKVGTIACLVNTRISQLVVPDGNELGDFISNSNTHNWDCSIVIRNIKKVSGILVPLSAATEKVYLEIGTLGQGAILTKNTTSEKVINIIAKIGNCENPSSSDAILYQTTNVASTINYLYFETPSISMGARKIATGGSVYNRAQIKEAHIVVETLTHNYVTNDNGTLFYLCNISNLYVNCEAFNAGFGYNSNIDHIHIGYITNDKTKSIYMWYLTNNSTLPSVVELQHGICKNIDIAGLLTNVTEENIYTYILQHLKQDEADCGDGLTITLGSTNLAKLTSAESVALLDSLTNTYGYTFA